MGVLEDFQLEAEAKRKAQEEENSQYDTTGAIQGALASLGAAFQGGNSLQAVGNVQAQRDAGRKEKSAALQSWIDNKKNEIAMKRQGVVQGREDEQYANDNDANSEYAKTLQSLARKYTPGIDFNGKTPAELMKLIPTLEKTWAVEESRKKRQDELAQKKELKLAEQNAGLTEGRKALDKDFAKDYNEWTSSGKSALDKNLERLENAKTALAGDPSLTGSIRGYLPDFIRSTTNEKAIVTRDDVRAAAQGALKATLGSQFTEKEGERIMNQAYNERLSPEENIAKIDAAIKELKTNRTNNDRKSSYFQQKGTLTGLEAPKSIVKTQVNPKTGQKRVVYSDGTSEVISSVAGGQ